MGWLASEAWKACAVPWKLARIEAGMFICRSAAWMFVTASPSAIPGARLNDSVTAGKKPWWFTASGVVPAEKCVMAESGTWLAGGGLDVDRLQRVRVLLVGGRDLEDDVVLVERREDVRDLALAEGVVERVVDELRQDAEPRGRVAIDDERGLQPAVLLVGGDVAEPLDRPELREHPRGEGVELAEIRALQRVLVLRIAHAPADPHVLHRLEEEGRPRHVGELPAQALDHEVDRDLPLAPRLEHDEHAPGVRRIAAAAREGDHVADVRDRP